MNNSYYDGIHSEVVNHLEMPIKLVISEKYEGVSDIAKIVYTILRNLISTQVQMGNAKHDDKGVFVTFSRKEMARYMNRSESQAERAFHCLEHFGLIEIERQKSGRPSKIRVLYLE